LSIPLNKIFLIKYYNLLRILAFNKRSIAIIIKKADSNNHKVLEITKKICYKCYDFVYMKAFKIKTQARFVMNDR